MKKSMVMFVFALLTLQVVLAVELEMKTEFRQGETLIARISGNFLDPILMENVFFYRGHVRIPMEYDVAKINDEFYVYALLDKPEEDYIISVENVRYMVGKDISTEDIKGYFHVTNETADFSVSPGFIVTEDDFEVTVQNLQDKKLNLTISDIYGSYSIILLSGEIRKLSFELEDNDESEFSVLELSTENLIYQIPVYIYSSGKPEKPGVKNFRVEPSELKISMPTNYETKRILYLHNTGEVSLKNTSVFISENLADYLIFSIEEFDELNPNSSIRIELSFLSPPDEGLIDGKLTIKDGDTYSYTDILVNFIPGFVSDDGEEPAEVIVLINETCAEKQGVICKIGEEECNGKTVSAKDDFCCLGSCEEIKKSSTGKIIGWSMILVLFLFLVWFFKTKYRSAKKKVNLLDFGKRK